MNKMRLKSASEMRRYLGRRRGLRRLWFLGPLLALTLLTLGTPASAAVAKADTGTGGTVDQSNIGVAISYVLPIAKLGASGSGTNTNRFNWLMYPPLYQLSNSGGLDSTASIANPPVYSNGDKTVTFTLRNIRWSDGEPVTSRDVAFYYNLVVANKQNWTGYTPGLFPDNVTGISTPNAKTVVVQLTHAFNPTWYTDDQLANWLALPQHAWDKTSASGPIGNYDQTPSGAQQVFNFLNSEAADTATYATNPLWKVVDGAWEIKSFQPGTGPDVFTPNPQFVPKPKISQFVETFYTTDSAEFNALLSNQIQVGILPPEDLPEFSRISSSYNLTTTPYWRIAYDVMNFNNPVTGPIVKQLYFRQALQHLEDEVGQTKAYLDSGKAGYPLFGPLPPQPASTYEAAIQKTDAYPFSISAARSLLQQHGWTIPAQGPGYCSRPGTAANECGAGIPQGQKLEFNFEYDTDGAYLDGEVQNFKSDAAKAGIVLNLSSGPFAQVVSDLRTCNSPTAPCPASSWQLGTWNANGYSGDYTSSYPNMSWVETSSNYRSTEFEKLLAATQNSPDAVTVMRNLDTYVTKNLPVLWTLGLYGLNVVSKDLKGVQFPSSAYENTADWVYTHGS